MSLVSTEALIFAAILFIIYYIIPSKYQWCVLLAGSLYFYFRCGVRGFLFLVGVAAISYAAGILIEKAEKQTAKKLLCIAIVVIITALLCVLRLPFASWLLPMGFSFYSLQCISYCIDIYRGSFPCEKNPLRYLLYISFFPHVLQGPFADYLKLKPQLDAPHAFSYEDAVKSCYRIAYGVMKKIVVADRLSPLIDTLYSGESSYEGSTLIFILLLYTIQLYADFSGCMDMMIGCARLFGIELQENFNVPYGSKNMEEFWRRWHMSLGLWFKNYVFYPLLRSKPLMKLQSYYKKKKNKYLMRTLPTVLALAVNWTLIGVWHGFGLPYLVYDWFCGFWIILAVVVKPLRDKWNSKLTEKNADKFLDPLRMLRTYLLVAFSFIFFRAPSMETAGEVIRNIFRPLNLYEMAEYIYWNSYDLFLIAIPVLLMLIVDILKYKEKDVCEMLHRLPFVIRWGIYLAGLLLIWIAKSDSGVRGFAYSVF